MALFKHFEHMAHSLLQSAVEEVLGEDDRSSASGHELMQALHKYSEDKAAGKSAPEPPEPDSAVSSAEYCAWLHGELLWAKVSGDENEIKACEEKLEKFTICDPRWAEILPIAWKYFDLEGKKIPYRMHKSMDDFVLDTLPEQGTIAVIGDWGTGEKDAVDLLKKVAEHKPLLLIHLGDVYYAGTKEEQTNYFLNICRDVVGDIPLFTLSGNHDMYSGGAGYYGLLDEIGQPASYFALRNSKMQFLAMDTGYHDTNPLDADAMTWLEASEAEWHVDKLKRADGRSTVLLSHNQLYTYNSGIGGEPLNKKLLDVFGPYLGQVNLWLWGHEHNMVGFEPFAGLNKGRCVGCSAVPQSVDQDLYELNPKFKGKDHPVMIDAMKLGTDSERALYNLGYSIMNLDGAAAEIEYFEYIRSSDSIRSLYKENI